MWVPGQHIDGDYQAVASHSNAPLIAAALRDGSVQVYDDEATRFENLGLRKESIPAKLAWHPSKKYLAVAWSGGVVGLWCIDAESILREGKIHQCRVTCLEWGPLGNRLVSGDEDGCVVVWKIDGRGRLSTMSQYRLKGQITCCVFRLATTLTEARMRDKDSPPFFLAGLSGTVYYADDIGHCSEAVSVSTNVISLFVTESRETLSVLCEDLSLSRYTLSADGKLTQDSSIKLSGGLKSLGINLQTAWVEPELLAITVNGSPVRIWDAQSEDTAILDRQDLGSNTYKAFGYNKRLQIMAVGADNGLVVLWQMLSTQKDNERVRSWEPLHKLDLGGGGIVGLSWGISESVLVVRKLQGFQIVSQQTLCSAAFGSQIVAAQVGSNRIVIERQGGNSNVMIETKDRVRALQVTPEALAVFTGKMLDVYKLDGAVQPQQPSAFITSQSALFAINSKFLFAADQNKIDAYNHQGLLKHSLLLPREEGDIYRLLCTPFSLVLLTREHTVKVFDFSGRDPRLVFARSLRSKAVNGEIVLFSANSSASMVSFVTSNDHAQLWVCNLEQDVIFGHNFMISTITSLFWDVDDSRVLICEIGLAMPQGDENTPKPQIASFFATSDSSLIPKDTQPYPDKCEKLIGVAIPHFVYLRLQEMQPDQISRSILVPGREYIGVENDSSNVIKAITDFCFNLATGNIDEAIKSIKLVRSESVWENMARICTKLGRTELARLCMGKLKNAKALRSIHAKNEWGEEALNRQSILTAVHLGLYEDAYSMCTSMRRFDLLSEIYQCTNRWENAIEICASKDRPALPTVFFKFAEYLKETGDWFGAIAAYEKADTSKTYVPRMLLLQPQELWNYIDSSTDPSLKLWWARNAESHGDYETAIKYYGLANDVLSIVRVQCLAGHMREAVRLVDENPENAAAAFYIGRQFEDDGKVQQAIMYYARSKAFTSAIRLAKQHGIDQELMQLALQAGPESMSDVARYFENQGTLSKAGTLYSKAGNVSKALDICFKIKDTSLLETISGMLDPERDAKMLEKAASFLVEQGATQNALSLMIAARRYNEVLKLCESHGLQLTEELVEKMDIDGTRSESDAKARHMRIADICFAQGAYQVACKQYTLGGDRLRAMGSLLKSGEKDKIIFFANVSGPRQPEIFVIAANYLQSLDWRTDTSVMKSIIQFYTKAKAHAALSRFYGSCALIEIDEFQNYEKALGALKEAEKSLSKVTHPSATEKDELEVMRRKIRRIGMFIEAYEQSKGQRYDEVEKVCSALLTESDIDSDVRIGDIYGLLIESNYHNGQYDKARKLLAALSQRLVNVSVDYYVDRGIVKALGGAPEPEPDTAESIEEDY